MRVLRRVAPLALVVVLLFSTPAQADVEPHAADGQTFATQSPDTQTVFQTVWGASAAERWIQEHNAIIGLAVPQVAAPAPARTVIISMTDTDSFAPAMLRVPRGTSVTWHNDDTDPHSVTGDPARSYPGVKIVEPAGAAPFDSGLLDAGENYTYAFSVPGHYIYVCLVHAGKGMIATLDVG